MTSVILNFEYENAYAIIKSYSKLDLNINTKHRADKKIKFY